MIVLKDKIRHKKIAKICMAVIRTLQEEITRLSNTDQKLEINTKGTVATNTHLQKLKVMADAIRRYCPDRINDQINDSGENLINYLCTDGEYNDESKVKSQTQRLMKLYDNSSKY